MKTWENLKVTDIGNINDGDWILNKNYSKFGVRLLQVGDIGLGKFVDKTNKFISENTASKLNVSIVTPGKDILVARMPDPIGRACIAPFLPYKYIVAVDISILKVDESRFDIRYIMQLLNSKPILSKVQQKSAGATRIRISRTNLESIKLRVPLLSEQTAIANILSTVDEAIQKADEAITKTERIKQAMMQKLLAEGIGHKEFRQTKIGKIPKEWVIRKIGEVINKSGKIDPTKLDNEFYYVDISSINNQTFKIINTNKIDKNNAPSRARKLIKKGNIIYATTRPYLQNIALVPQSLDNQICSTGFCVMEPDEAIISYKWLFYNVITSRFNKRIESKMKGATYPAVNDSDLYEEFISVPSIKEQTKITETLDDFSKKLDLEISRKQSLEKIKQGLMDDLLTGKKRIKIN